MQIKINGVANSGALKALGRITGVVGVYDHLSKGIENGDWVETTKGVLQAGVMIFGGEELELAYNLADLGVTFITNLLEK